MQLGVLNRLVFANPSVRAGSMNVLLDLVRRKPGSVSCATKGNTSFNSLLIAWHDYLEGRTWTAGACRSVARPVSVRHEGIGVARQKSHQLVMNEELLLAECLLAQHVD